MRVTSAIQKPSFVAARPYYWYFQQPRNLLSTACTGTSPVGGYYLLVVCILSFVQWYLLGFLLDLLKARINQVNKTRIVFGV